MIGFGVPPLVRLKNVPALRVLRRELGGAKASGFVIYSLGITAFSALIFVQAGDIKMFVKAG